MALRGGTFQTGAEQAGCPVGPSLPCVTSGGPNPPDGVDYKLPDRMLYGLTDGTSLSLNVGELSEHGRRVKCRG